MDQQTRERMTRLSEWMRGLYREYAKAMLDHTGEAPPEWQFARDVLGTSDYNYFRWRDSKNPINDLNLLMLAINTGDMTPLRLLCLSSQGSSYWGSRCWCSSGRAHPKNRRTLSHSITRFGGFFI